MVVIALAVGYWFGQKKECSDCPPKYVTAEDIKQGDKLLQLIGLEEAKALDSNFVLFKQCNLSPELRTFFETPLTIDSAKSNFEDIFKQDGYAGLRAYPGVKYNSKTGEIYFTMIFIGVDSSGNPISKNTIPEQNRNGVPANQAPIQDNNTPCKPCTRLFRTQSMSDSDK